ncbi:MAG: hypothetical protein WDW38_010879 [Sanguina aurantia]
MADSQNTTASDHSVFVGDLLPEVHDQYLEIFFKQYYPSVRSAKVITDVITNRSKGYGFVRFGSEVERDRCLVEMNGAFIASRPIRVSLAIAKRNPAVGMNVGPGGEERRQLPATIPGGTSQFPSSQPGDADNTTLFIGGLSTGVTEEQLRGTFSHYGDIIYTKIPMGKGCGFVQFVERKAAEYAMAELNGSNVGGGAMRISWGRSHTKGPHPPPSQPANAFSAQGASAYTSNPYAMPTAYNQYGPSAFNYAAYAANPYGDAASSLYGNNAAQDPYLAALSTYGGMSAAASYGLSAAGGGMPSGGYGGASGSSLPTLYDPLADVSLEKLNAAFIQRNLPLLSRNFMRYL